MSDRTHFHVDLAFPVRRCLSNTFDMTARMVTPTTPNNQILVRHTTLLKYICNTLKSNTALYLPDPLQLRSQRGGMSTMKAVAKQ